MASPTGLYVARINALSVTAAITLIQIKAGAATACEILRAWMAQSSSTTSAQQRIQIVRKTVAATVTSFTPLLLTNCQAAKAVGGTSATGTNASAEGTDGDVLYPDAFNVLNGWLYVPVPEERIIVPPGGIIGIKFPAAPGGATDYSGGVVFQEIG